MKAMFNIECWNSNAESVAAMLRRNWFVDAVAIDSDNVRVTGDAKLSSHTFELLIEQRLDGDKLDYDITMVES